MATLTMFLNTPVTYFQQWLEKYTMMLPLAPMDTFRTERGRYCLQRARAIGRGHSMGIEGFYLCPGKEPNTETGYPCGSIITFDITPLSPERIEVQVDWHAELFDGYMAQLLADLSVRWPEAAREGGTVKPDSDALIAGMAIWDGDLRGLEGATSRALDSRRIPYQRQTEPTAGTACFVFSEPSYPLQDLFLLRLGPERTEGSSRLRPGAGSADANSEWARLCEPLDARWARRPEKEATAERMRPEGARGPTEKTIETAKNAKAVKDKHPTWSMPRVAAEVDSTPDAIRFAYRKMGWKWERADRVRPKR